MNTAAAIPFAPKTRRVRPGMYQTRDPQGNVWTVEERRDTFGGGNGWAWFASQDSDWRNAIDPTPTKTDAVAAIACHT